MTGDDADFEARRDAARQRLNRIAGGKGGDAAERLAWFETVYETAGGDPVNVPWADLAAKPQLADWLGRHPGEGKTAIDVACGLGDNAEALAAAGYRASAFDLSERAIAWAKERFPQTTVDYRSADLFALPTEWQGAFDVVHECYTVQALDGDLRSNAIPAIARLVAPGGRLLLITRIRPEGTTVDGPPWPLTPGEIARFDALGFAREEEKTYEVRRGDRVIPHVFIAYRKG